ncbi:hypothetical protein PWEIH_01902 [Listeria weihenstephanensis FSL R9-0317]|uniref:HTH crp-type domain-containing protein n=1 Tax=Listeria weihenstephanensis TaxID=1006155 RepID=A0A1S7FQK2_9LIST|nr:Crp/Fnr family transcriptional regulator [Listeria weihenstephanensis]AQY49731.1 hypothetical protein UE46_00730 [Listeria weihenstephanensis]EUJ41022.1 hypothetical protein PWEIH_01902 [Listeria weihenstephanensis FSL R9-0317]
MESLELIGNIQEHLLNRYKNDPFANKHIELLKVKKATDIWHYVDSEKYYICFLEGAACLEERIHRSSSFGKPSLNSILLFKNEIYDIEKYFIEENSKKSLQTLTPCYIMFIEKFYIHVLLESGFPLDKQLFQNHINQVGIKMLQNKVKWLSLPADQRLYEVLKWCIHSSEETKLPKYITQDTISKISNISREYTNMLLKKLQQEGLITLHPTAIN